MPPALNLKPHLGSLKEALSTLAAGALDDVGTLARLKPFAGDHVVIDVWLPTPRLAAAKRLVAADPAAWCPLHESDAVIGIAGPVEPDARPPWRYRVGVARRDSLLSPDGTTLPGRRLVDEATGVEIILPPPERKLTAAEGYRLLGIMALILSLSWALTGAAVFLERSAASTAASARTLAASAGPSRDSAQSRRAALIYSLIAGREDAFPVSAIAISADEVRLTLPDGSIVIPTETDTGAAWEAVPEPEQFDDTGAEP